MLKVALISVFMVCCGAQLNVAVAPGPAVASIAQPTGQLQYLSGYEQLASPLLNPIYRVRTQEVLPSQDLDVSVDQQSVNVRSNQEPVLVHYQTHSAPIQVQTSHVPSAPGETTVTQVEDEPHRVIHEVIRPVIQEVREIIQPYRRVTQEIRPVQEQVHSEVSTGGAVGAQVAVAAPIQQAVSVPARTLVAAQAPTLVSAPAQAVYGGQYQYGNQYQYAAPVQSVSRGYSGGLGVISAPSPLYTGSYIQAFIDQLRSRQSLGGVVISQPNYGVQAVQTVQPVAQPVVEVAEEPLAVSEAVSQVKAPQRVVANRGSVTFTQKHVEY